MFSWPFKRPGDANTEGDETPSSKRPRNDDAAVSEAAQPSPATLPTGSSTTTTASHGRIVLDIGGTRFVSSRSTLEGASSYFRSLLLRWTANTDAEPLFLDCDADAFQVLLSYMRSSSIVLPQHDLGLCTRVLLLAEYLGLELFLSEVKSRAYAHMHLVARPAQAAATSPSSLPEANGAATSAAPGSRGSAPRSSRSMRTPPLGSMPARALPADRAFDEECGTLQDAITSGVLPARFFGPAAASPPVPPVRTVRALIPAQGYTAVFCDDDIVDGEMPETNDSRPIISFALVECRDGTQVVDALIQPSITHYRVEVDGRDERTRSQLTFASEYAYSVPWGHWVVVPPVAQSLLPIPAGTVRGVWKRPVFSTADHGKLVTLTAGSITVDGEARLVQWDDGAPPDASSEITLVEEGFANVHLASGATFINPASAEMHGETTKQVDLAFAQAEHPPTSGTGSLATRFYLPLATYEDGAQRFELADPRQVTFSGGLEFSHFAGATKN